MYQAGSLGLRRFTEELIEGRAGIAGAARDRYVGRWNRGLRSLRGVPGDREPRLEQLALIGEVLTGDANGNRLQALKSCRRLKVGALLAAMQRSIALGTRAAEIDVDGKHGGTIEAARARYHLNQPR